MRITVTVKATSIRNSLRTGHLFHDRWVYMDIDNVWFNHRGSYMSAHVLLILLNELGKGDKMRGLSSILSLFRGEFNKFDNTRARILDNIYHMTLRVL